MTIRITCVCIWQVTAFPRGPLGGYLTVLPANSTVPAGGVVTLALNYDVNALQIQGLYQADVLIKTNARPVVKVVSCPSPLNFTVPGRSCESLKKLTI